MESSSPTASAADPEQLARAYVAGQPHLRHLGAEVTSAAAGRCELRLPHRPELTQHDGCFHEGVIATLAASAGAAAAHTMLPPSVLPHSTLPHGSAALTVEFKVNIMAPGGGESLVARGQVIRSGKSLTVCRVEVFAVRSGKETPCATCLMTLMAVAR
jgi:uncharacterized protein (TIGR00369 family)